MVKKAATCHIRTRYPQAEKPAAQTAHLFFAKAQFQRSKK